MGERKARTAAFPMSSPFVVYRGPHCYLTPGSPPRMLREHWLWTVDPTYAKRWERQDHREA
jgi:hypothetical protein